MSVRSRQEVRGDILRVARMGAIKTRIVYGAYLNFSIVKGHLFELIKSGRLVQRGKKFYTTDRGLDYIRHLEAMR